MSEVFKVFPSNITNQPVNMQVKPKENIKTEEDKSDNKTFLYSAAAVAGLAILAGVMMLKGKGNNNIQPAREKIIQNIQDTASNFQKGVRQFFNESGESIENITIKKGKALNADGNIFTGIMTTMNANGENVLIEYGADGYISKSTVNGKIRAIFTNIKDNYYGGKLDRSKGFCVEFFKGEKKQKYIQTYHKNGSIDKIIKSAEIDSLSGGKESGVKMFEFYPDGKKHSEFEFIDADSLDYPFKGTVFFEDGKTIKKVFDGQIERVYSKDGSLQMEKIVPYGYKYTSLDSFGEKKPYNYNVLNVYNPNGSRISYVTKRTPDGMLLAAENSENIHVISVPLSHKLGNSEDLENAVIISYIKKGESTPSKDISIHDDKIVNHDNLTKNQLLSVSEDLQQAVQTAKKEGLSILAPKGENYGVSYERFEKYINMLKEFALKMTE